MTRDPRITLANDRVAHVALQGEVEAPRYAELTRRIVQQPLVNILNKPGGRRDSQLLFGETFEVLDRDRGHAFGRSGRDGYVGYVVLSALGEPEDMTHWVTSPATHLYPKADMKAPPEVSIFFGSLVRVVAEREDFLRIHTGHFVPRSHVKSIKARYGDPVAVADTLLGTPYVWGGTSRWGIDCSGLVQASLLACGMPCPRDSDQQEMYVGKALAQDAELQRGDLVFWKGHVGIMASDTMLLHANAFHMAVAYEPLDEAVTRIEAAGDGPITRKKRVRV